MTPQQKEVGTDQFSFRCVVYSVSPEHGGVVSVLSSVSIFTDAGAHIKFALILNWKVVKSGKEK